MKGLFRRAVRRSWRVAWRGLTAGAVIAKLLVPFGYMPAALADGGFRLCDGYLPSIDMPMGAAHMGSDTLHDHSAPHAMHGSGVPAEAPAAGAGNQAPLGDHGGHHHWDHCPLGALATLAAIAPADWQLPLYAASTEPVRETDREAFVPRTVGPFQSRAPPSVHS